MKPRLYVAAGISGAPEHVEGMKDAELIVAVNTDAGAPIFSVAHYGIVEDATDVLEALAEAVREAEGVAPMPDPTTSSLLGIPGYVFLWVLTLAALALFGLRAYRLVTALARGRAEARWDRLPRRLWNTVVNVAGQRRMFANPGIGLAHLVIFWTFLFYAVTLRLEPAARPAALPADPLRRRGRLDGLPHGVCSPWRPWWPSPGRRSAATVFTPARLERSRDATIILLLISLLLVTFLMGQGAKAAAEEGPASWSPVGGPDRRLAGRAVGRARPSSLFLAMWWLHMTAVLGFLAYLLYSKHLHLLASPFSVFAASLEPGAMPPSSEGAARLEEFTWRELYNGLACAECGRCDRACPAFASGGVLSPKDLVHQVKLTAAGRGRPSATGTRDLIGAVGARGHLGLHHLPGLHGELPRLQRAHPADRRDAPPADDPRRGGPGVQDMLTGLTRYGNSFGQSPRKRAKWAQRAGLRGQGRPQGAGRVPVVRRATTPPSTRGSRRSPGRWPGCSTRAGLDFGILLRGASRTQATTCAASARRASSRCCGRRTWQRSATAQYRAIVTTDPHTYHALKNEYGLDGRVVHYTEVLDELIAAGRLPVVARRPAPGSPTTTRATWAATTASTTPPRRVLAALGAEGRRDAAQPGREPTAAAPAAGRIWMEDAPGGGERPAESRVREAAGARRGGHHGGGLPQGPGHVPGRPQDHRAGGGARGAGYR